jgi:hypothetical protein
VKEPSTASGEEAQVNTPATVLNLLLAAAAQRFDAAHAAEVGAVLVTVIGSLVPAVSRGAETAAGRTAAPAGTMAVYVPSDESQSVQVEASDMASRTLLAALMLATRLLTDAETEAATAAALTTAADFERRVVAVLVGVVRGCGMQATASRDRATLRPVAMLPAFEPLPNPRTAIFGPATAGALSDDGEGSLHDAESVHGGGDDRVTSFAGPNASATTDHVSSLWESASYADTVATSAALGHADQPYAALDRYLPSAVLAQYCALTLRRLSEVGPAGNAARHAMLADLAPLLLELVSLDAYLFPPTDRNSHPSAEVRALSSPLCRSVSAIREHAMATLGSLAEFDADWLLQHRSAISTVLACLHTSGIENMSRRAALLLAHAARHRGVEIAVMHREVLPAVASLLRRDRAELQHPATIAFANVLDRAWMISSQVTGSSVASVNTELVSQSRLVADAATDLLLPQCDTLVQMAGSVNADGRRAHDAARLVACLVRHSRAVADLLNQRNTLDVVLNTIDATAVLVQQHRETKTVTGTVGQFAWCFFALQALLERSANVTSAARVAAHAGTLAALAGALGARPSSRSMHAVCGSTCEASEEMFRALTLLRALLRLADAVLVPALIARGALHLLAAALSDPDVAGANKQLAGDALVLMRNERYSARGARPPSARPPPPDTRLYAAPKWRKRATAMQLDRVAKSAL